MAEILGHVCQLAQDQYGNYVVQHVLEHGQWDEKMEIVAKLAGQIVEMSQHKFASNVVERCLQHGGQQGRQMIVNEMLGQTEEADSLQAMMKDQYANYVVQKVRAVFRRRLRNGSTFQTFSNALETCKFAGLFPCRRFVFFTGPPVPVTERMAHNTPETRPTL
eukprot:6018350-Pyramimonas_sp.AAC.1